MMRAKVAISFRLFLVGLILPGLSFSGLPEARGVRLAAGAELRDAQSGAAPQTAARPAPAAPARGAAAQKQPAAGAPNADAAAAAWKLLSEGAASRKYTTRSDAISTLVVLGTDRRAVSLIERALKDKESIIRVLAAVSLGEIQARAAIPALRAALDDKSPQVSFAAAQALWKMGDRSGRDELYEILEGERKAQPGVIQSDINKARQDLHDPKTMMFMGVHATAAAFLGPGALGVSAVEEFATNRAAPVQALCAKLLAEDNTSDTVEALTEALDDKSWVVRAAAARALATMKHPEVTPKLRNLMENDSKEAVRFAAAAAVVRLSAPARAN